MAVNVLVIHQHFKTPEEGGALRSYFLGKALVDAGHKARIITAHNDEKYIIRNVEGMEVHYLPVLYSNHFGFWKRILAFTKFISGIVFRSAQFKDADVCYAISVPLTVGWAAQWMKWRYNIPYIFEVGDLWPDAPIELEVIENSLLKKFLWWMERHIYKHAQSIVALSPPIKDAITTKISGKNILVIPNMADTEFFKPEPKDWQLEEKFKVKGKLVISYFGAMGFANGLEYLLKAALECQKLNLPVHFTLTGDGAERENLLKKAEMLQLKNTSFQSFQNRNGIRELMNVTDIVFVSYRKAIILETGSPNKFFDGLAAGKPIVVNFGGWIKDEIDAAGCGWYVNPQNQIELASKLKSLLTEISQAQYQESARQLAEQKFSRKKLTEEWLKLFQS